MDNIVSARSAHLSRGLLTGDDRTAAPQANNLSIWGFADPGHAEGQ